MDTLVTVPNYPKEDTKLRALSSKAAGGGPTGTGLVAAQKLGEEAAYIGVLSDDNGGKFLIEDFKKRYTSIPFAVYSRNYGNNENEMEVLSFPVIGESSLSKTTKRVSLLKFS